MDRIEFRKVFNDVRCSEWKIISDLFDNSFISLNRYLLNEYKEDPILLVAGYNHREDGIFEDKFDYQFRYVNNIPPNVIFDRGFQFWIAESNVGNGLPLERALHRDDGPASLSRHNEPEWYFDGKHSTDRIVEFEQKINKRYFEWSEEEWAWFKLT